LSQRLAAPMRWLRRRLWGSGASGVAVCLALSCGLSPGIELPSAVDGPVLDGETDGSGLDLIAGTGGAASGAGGSPGCTPLPPITECHGAELWQGVLTTNCTFILSPLQVCEAGCITLPDGVAACDTAGYGGAGGLGGSAGAASSPP
jgi:hypothetical protein